MNFIFKWWYDRKRKKDLAKAPKDLEEALDTLDHLWPEEDKKSFASEDGKQPGSRFHFFGGMYMRNNWGLWIKEQPLTQWFRANGIWHADDMSAIIYKAFWFKLNNKNFDITREAKHYADYWRKQGLGFDGEPISDLKFPMKVEIKVKKNEKVSQNKNKRRKHSRPSR